MNDVFHKLLQLDISAAPFILILFILRTLCTNVPKSFYHRLWLAAFALLIIPFKFEIKIPVKASTTQVLYNTITSSAETKPQAASSFLSTSDFNIIACQVWLAAAIIILAYTLVKSIALSRRLKAMPMIEKGVYLSCNSKSFVFGIEPKIYLASNVSEQQKQYVLCHEKAHISQLDYITVPTAFIIAAIHWYNPLAWLSFAMLSADAEMACDEIVLQRLGAKHRKDYAIALLEAAHSGLQEICFSAFPIKKRIVNIMKIKAKCRPWLVFVFAAVLLCSCAQVHEVPLVNDSVEISAAQAKESIKTNYLGHEIISAPTGFSFGYIPSQFDVVGQVYIYDTQPQRLCVRYALSDSSQYIIVQRVAAGSDEIFAGDAENIQVRSISAQYFTVSSTDFINFDDAEFLGANLPNNNDNILVFTEKGNDYYVYGNITREEIIKTADNLGIAEF